MEYIQHARSWKYNLYVSDRAHAEAKHDVGMLNIHPEDASQAAFLRVCCYIDYKYPRSQREGRAI